MEEATVDYFTLSPSVGRVIWVWYIEYSVQIGQFFE